MPDENGVLVNYTSFYMNLNPLWNKEASIKLPTTDKTLFYHCIEGDEVYVTYDLLTELGINFQKFDMTENKRSISFSPPDITELEINEVCRTVTVRAGAEYIHSAMLSGNAIFDDNCFSLLPGEARTVAYRPLKTGSPECIEAEAYTLV